MRQASANLVWEERRWPGRLWPWNTCTGERGASRLSGWGVFEGEAIWVFYGPIESTGWSFAARITDRIASGGCRLVAIRWPGRVYACQPRVHRLQFAPFRKCPMV